MYSSTTPPPTSHPQTMISHVTTPVPSLHAPKSISDRKLSVAIPLATLRVTMETSSHASNNDQSIAAGDDEQKEDSTKISSEDSTRINDDDLNHVESITTNDDDNNNDDGGDIVIDTEQNSEKIEETTSVVEQRLKKISEELDKYRNVDNSGGGGGGAASADNHGPQSFLYLTDLLNTLRPNDKKVASDRKIHPQIDSDYSNTMHVLGETTSIVSGDDSRKIKTNDLRQTNRALY